MSVFAAARGSPRFDERESREIIELGRKALQRRQAYERAYDLLGLDGVSLPPQPKPPSVDDAGAGARMSTQSLRGGRKWIWVCGDAKR